jgi:hypothetical protein
MPMLGAFITRRVEGGDSGREALPALKRRLSDVVYRALQADLAVDDVTLAA